MDSFFDSYPAFFGSSRAGGAIRLRYRYDLLFRDMGHLFEGKRVVDIGSHDGRWSFCALQHGASFVMGIEAHDDTIEHGVANYRQYGIAEDKFKFLAGDVFKVIQKLDPDRPGERFDIGLCLGFLYHTTRHFETIEQLCRLGCRTLLVETNVMQDEKDTKVKYRLEDVGPRHNAFSETGVVNQKTVSAIPSVSAMVLLLESFGFKVRILPLPPLDPVSEGGEDQMPDFRIGRRVAFLATMD